MRQAARRSILGGPLSSDLFALRQPVASGAIKDMSPDSSSTGQPPTTEAARRGAPLIRSLLGGLAGLAIAVAATLLFLPHSAHRPGSASFRSEQTRMLTVQLVNSIKAFYTEYSMYPLPATSTGAEFTVWRTDARFTAVLMGTDTSLNPKKIKFLPDLKARPNRDGCGLAPTDDGVALVDAWGEPLHLLLDADYSGDMLNPDPTAAKKTLNEGVLVFSAGPDKDPSTWEDNVSSWRSRPLRR